MHIKVDQNKTKVDLNSLAICKEIAKIDSDKLSQREVSCNHLHTSLVKTFMSLCDHVSNCYCNFIWYFCLKFEIKEFDYDTFQQTIEYIHNGQCKLSYETIPGLICAAEVSKKTNEITFSLLRAAN